MDPVISVILPIYNMEAYLARCLDSVLNNTYRNLEVICVDDGSRDRSLEILRQYEKEDSRIVVIAKENGGVSSARNAGLDRMTGTYFSFIDPDDFVHPQYFELLLRAMTETESDFAACGYLTVEENEAFPPERHLAFSGEAVSVLSCRQYFQRRELRSFCCGRLIKTNLLGELRFHEEIHYAEDAVFFAELWERNEALRFCFLQEKLYRYLQRGGSAVKSAREHDRIIVAKLFAQKALLSPRNEEIYLEQSVRRLLNSRYYLTHIYPDRAEARACSTALRPCVRQMRRSPQYTAKEKLLYSVFSALPGAYWLFRVTRDPSMWKWEKAERKKRRQTR